MNIFKKRLRFDVGIIDAAFFAGLIVSAILFLSWLAYVDTQHKADSELRLSGVYDVEGSLRLCGDC